jgi:hypothetical protein
MKKIPRSNLSKVSKCQNIFLSKHNCKEFLEGRVGVTLEQGKGETIDACKIRSALDQTIHCRKDLGF